MKLVKNILGIIMLTMMMGAVVVPSTVSADTSPAPTTSVPYDQSFLQGEYQAARNKLGRTTGPRTTADVINIVRNILTFILGFLGLLLVCIVMYAGFLWMTARGIKDQVAKAQKYLINAAIGLAIIISASGISAYVFNQISASINNTSQTQK